MKKLIVFSGVLFLPGLVMLVLPYHMQMTGIILCMLGAAAGVCTFLFSRKSVRCQRFGQILAILAAAGVVVLIACMNIITTSGRSDWERAETSDYAVVLGANVHANGTPSRIMRSRLQAAFTFMERNPEAVVIVSGGQGPDEPISEAKCMYDTLVQMGAEESRLLMEDESHTTRENLINSERIMAARGGTEKPITVITSEFHQRRAAYIADSLGLQTCPVSGHTDQWFFRINYTLREVFAFVKAVFQSGMD